ncbi:MAG: extracellular solute-binding protein [Tranquillimonas sp.]
MLGTGERRRARHGLAAGLALALLLAGTAVAQTADTTVAQTAETTVAHGISTFGDLKYPAGFDHFDYADPDAPVGGVLSFRGTGASRTFDSLNPFILKGEPAQGLERLYDSLLIASDDEPASSYGLIAETVAYPPDRQWAEFTIREAARFSDGQPITADDVVFTFGTLRAEGLPTYRILLADVESVEALGPRKVRFTFRKGAATRDLPAQVGAIPILPRHYYGSVPFGESSLTPPVGSGRYLIEDVQAGRSISYRRNPDYWGWDLPVNRGRDNFETVVYEYFGDTTAAFEALKVGQYLFHEEYSSALWATNYDFPALEKGWVRREELPDARPSGTQGFWLNLRREKFADPRVREAIALMFNFEWSNRTLFYGLYRRTDSFWENTDLQAEGPPDEAERALLQGLGAELPEGILTEPAYEPAISSADQQVDRRALRRASSLLEEAGWTVGADGLRRNAKGETLTVAFLDDNPAFERIILPYIANLRRLGVDARLEMVDAAQMQQRQEDFDYDITPGRLVMSLSPSVELRSLFGSAGAQAPGTLNLAGVADPAVDALIENVIAAESRDELILRVRALDRLLRASHVWVPNWYRDRFWLAYWDVFGRPETKPPYARGDDYWWFEQEKYEALRRQGALR